MKPRLLVIDDDRWFAEALMASLRARYTAEWVAAAQPAAELLDDSARRPDVIILDMLMPDGNGLAFLQELRSYADTARLPVILCSSLRLERQAGALAQLGIRHIFNKATITLAELERAVADSLRVAAHA
ncbi:response regulator [Candidatus Saccharibacteria bacterium]|nr:response regulator [Candidatus Saccharibacteria bacterium]